MTIGAKALVDNPKGLPIIDANEDIILDVRAAGDISEATPMSPSNCAIARCCKRSVKGVVKATINKSTAYLEYRDKIVRFIVPQAIAREIVAFDRNAPFAEGQYVLKRPCAGHRLDRVQKREKRHNDDGSRGPQKQLRHITVMVRGA